MTASEDIERIQPCIRNRLDRGAIGTKHLVAVIGDTPSRYSKSPSLWNAAFQELRMSAVYVALDVDAARLSALMTAIRKSDRCLGLNVTVPHKLAVLNYLDAMDETATRIGAVNTIVRSEDGELLGANTDGEGFMQSLLTVQPNSAAPFVGSLKNVNALILGAGGSARAVAFALAENLEHGRLYIANRTHESAVSLAAEVGKSRAGAEAIREEEIPNYTPRVNIIVNCTTKGQSGFLEPYSALAPANPVNASEPASASLADIEANNDASWKLALSVPPGVGFYDLIYHPTETVFLRHGRMSGHRTLNGRAMIVAQAAEAFFNHLCRQQLERAGLHTAETHRRILKTMAEAW
jgi:shikimate dehydrogenase